MKTQAQLVSISGLQPSQNPQWPGKFRLITWRLLTGQTATTYAYDPASLAGTGKHINNANKWWSWIQANGSDYSTIWEIGIMLDANGNYRQTTAKKIMGDGDVIPSNPMTFVAGPKNNPNNPPHIDQFHKLFK